MGTRAMERNERAARRLAIGGLVVAALAIVALVLALAVTGSSFAFAVLVVGAPSLALPGLIASAVARHLARPGGQARRLATAGIALGVVAVVLSTVVWILVIASVRDLGT